MLIAYGPEVGKNAMHRPSVRHRSCDSSFARSRGHPAMFRARPAQHDWWRRLSQNFRLRPLVRVQADLFDEEFANAIVLVHAASLPDWMLRVLAIVAIMEWIVADLV
jgi:hypothetical protein